MRLNFLSIGAGGHVLAQGDGRAKADRMAECLALAHPINTLAHDAVLVHGDSNSAGHGHGLGVLRRDDTARWNASVGHALMRREMAAVSSRGLMGLGKWLTLHKSTHAH